MTQTLSAPQALELLRGVARGLVADGDPRTVPDLSMRQMALLLTVHLDAPPHGVLALSATLGVTKPVVSRALDALERYGLVARRRDAGDRRRVFVDATPAGAAYLARVGGLVSRRAAEVRA